MFLRPLVGVIVFLLTFGFSLQVYARSIAEIQAEIEQKRQQEAAAAAESGHLHRKANTVEEKIEQLQDEIAGIQLTIDANTKKQDDLTNKIEAAQNRLEEQRVLLSANIRSMYIEGDISPLEMLASSSNISDFVDKQEYRDRIKESIVEIVGQVEKLKKQLDEQKKEVTAILAEQKALKGTLDAKEGEANAKLGEINQTKAGFDAQVKARKGDIAKLQQEIAAAQAALSRVDVGSLPSSGSVVQGQIIGTVGNTGNSFGAHLHLRAQWGSGGPVNPSNFLGSRWALPLNAPITQVFGVNQYFYGPGGHDGIDYGASAGTPIKAVESGTLYKGTSEQLVGHWYFGCMAMIQHSGGLISIYAHMESSNC